jgi:hypothetical protein
MSVYGKSLNAYEKRTDRDFSGVILNRSDLLVKVTGNKLVVYVFQNTKEQHLLLPSWYSVTGRDPAIVPSTILKQKVPTLMWQKE